tara:strand:+ start:622 stop:852 length:231 start_codon:yes stop_codon:yes gene_type:complete
MNLIKVTRYNGNHDVCYVRVDNITGVSYYTPDKCTIIYDGTDHAYYVSESVEQVLSMMKQALPANVLNIITTSNIA